MAEAIKYAEGCLLDYTPSADVAAGQVLQLADGRAAVALETILADQRGAVAVGGLFKVAKTTSMVLLDGGRLFWDHSANAGHFKTVNDRDFYLGTVFGDAASADTACYVQLNERQRVSLDALNGPSLSVATGTSAAGGFGLPQPYGGSLGLKLTATSEVQCVDILTVDRIATGKMIAEMAFRVGVNGSGSASDFNIGIANGTSASDADAVTNHVFFHVDGGALDLFAQSKDGTTTVTAQDTTVNVTAGSAVSDRVECWIDARDTADVKLYVEGVRVVSGSTFKLVGAAGPLGLLAHLEKTTGTETSGPIYIDRLVARVMDQ